MPTPALKRTAMGIGPWDIPKYGERRQSEPLTAASLIMR